MGKITNGRFVVEVEFRELAEDRGLSIHVYGPTSDKEEELLRFDCFEKKPHYHVAWSARNDPFISITSKNPFGWAIDKLGQDTASLLSKADSLPMTDGEVVEWAGTLSKAKKMGETVAQEKQG